MLSLALLLAVAEPTTQQTKLTNCFTKNNRDAATALLAATTLEEASLQAKKLKVRTSCSASGKYSGNYEFNVTSGSVDSLRALVAEMLLKEDVQKTAALPELAAQREYMRPWFVATGRHVSIDEMATCVAETDPQGVLKLLQTASGSADERTTFGSLKASFATCLRADIKLVGNRQVVRGALADALYQRTQSWPVTAPDVTGGVK